MARAHRSNHRLLDTGIIYCGDNLEELRNVPSESVDLIYIDPPFNSNRNYEVFWGEGRETRSFDDRHRSTMAYLGFMEPRCLELKRVLKPGGSFYFHCDWHASHYIKVMLDRMFGENNFINEIIWKRQSSHNDAKQGSKHLGRVHDTLLLYSGGGNYTFKHLYQPYDPEYVQKFYRNVEPESGRRYQLGDLGAPGKGAPSKGNPHYEFLGVTRYWRYSRENMQKLYDQGRIIQTSPGSVPRLKRYLDEGKGVPLGSVWDDIGPVQSAARESEQYPTQKPLKLLERIIEVSSNPGDVILDAFCGCGTALVAAQNLGREWIGIDVSPTACRVMARRLERCCGLTENESLWRIGRGFIVRDLIWTEDRLRVVPHFEFENWAVIALSGIPNTTKVGDHGIDGRIYPVSSLPSGRKKEDVFAFMDEWYPVQVKQKEKVGRPDIDAFEAVMMREDRRLGYFVSFGFTSDALKEIQAFYRREERSIVTLTVGQILNSQEEAKRIPPKSVRFTPAAARSRR